MPDLGGRTAVVTGASDGVGVEIARGLAGAGADLVLPVRNRAKAERAVGRLRLTAPDAHVDVRDLDLSSLASVRALAATLLAQQTPLDVVVLNAGIVLLGDRERHVSADGFERHFQTNFLGHFALTTALLPLLREHAARVVVQVSLAAGISKIAWDDLQTQHRYSALRAYGASKVALGLFGYELARRSAAEGWGLTVHLSHPGVVPATGIAPALRARDRRGLGRTLAQRVGNTPAQAAQPALLAVATEATPPGFFGPSGALQFGGRARQLRPYRRITDPGAGARLWAAAEALLRDREDAVRP
jgi:NAD(P)-dependent dehydrogenase (short-subunit alcohol dehydrogenase family)